MRFVDYRMMSDHDILNLGDAAVGAQRGAADAPVDHWVTIDHRHIPITEPQGRRASQQNAKEYAGDATYYNLPGAKTASGQRFDPNRMAAAMTAEKVKLGQTVKVTLRGMRMASLCTHSGRTRKVFLTLPLPLSDNWPEHSA